MGGVVGSVVGSIGSNLASSALQGGSSDASNAYAGQIANANAAIRDSSMRALGGYQPYRQAGLTSLNAYADLLGLSRPVGGYEQIEDNWNAHSSDPVQFTYGSGQRGGMFLQQNPFSTGDGTGGGGDFNYGTGAGYTNPGQLPGGGVGSNPNGGNIPLGSNLGLNQFFSTPEYQLLWGNSGAAVNPNASPIDRFMQNPAYQSGLKLANQALEASAAAKGNVLSGNQLKAVSQLNTDYGNQYFNQYQSNLSNTFTDYANRLASMAGMGMQAAQGNASVYVPQGQALSQNYTNLGDTMANSELASASARASGYTNTTNSLLGSGVSNLSGIGKGISSFFS